MLDATFSGEGKNAWEKLTLWKSPKFTKIHFWTHTGARGKGRALMRLVGKDIALGLNPKNLSRETIMLTKSLDVMPLNETLRVWGSYALHKASLGSARSSSCGSGTQKSCGIEASHIQKQTMTGQRGATWHYFHGVIFLSLGTSFKIEKPNENCLLMVSTETASLMILSVFPLLLARVPLG